MILLCPTCGQPGIDETAGRRPHPVRFCPSCNLVFDADPGGAPRTPTDHVVAGVAAYDGLDAARQALRPTPKDGQ